MCTTTIFSQHDLAILTLLLHAGGQDPSRAAPAMRRLADLARSARVGSAGFAPRRVALGAGVRYRVAGSTATESIVIASPEDPLAMLERVPVLAPLALALLGHTEGCTVEVALALGRCMRLDILEVQPPAQGGCRSSSAQT